MQDVIDHWFANPFIDPEAEGFYPINGDIRDLLPSFKSGESTEHEDILWTNDSYMAIWKKYIISPHYTDTIFPHFIVWERMATSLGRAIGAQVAPSRLCVQDGQLSNFSLIMADFNEAKLLSPGSDVQQVCETVNKPDEILISVFGTYANAYEQLTHVLALDLLTQNQDAIWSKHTLWGKDKFYTFDYGYTDLYTQPLELCAPLRGLGIEADILAWMMPEIIRKIDWAFFDAGCIKLSEALPKCASFVDPMQSEIRNRAVLYAAAPPTISERFDSLEGYWNKEENVVSPEDKRSSFILRPMRSAPSHSPVPRY